MNLINHRDLHLFADGNEIAQGCHLFLAAEENLSLLPHLHHLEIEDLSDSSSALLSGARSLEVRNGNSILAFGAPVEHLTHSVSGKHLTSVVFSPGLSLWQSSVSLSLSPGMRVSETIRKLLETSGTEIPLAAFTADDFAFFRPQAFFGRACDAVSMLAESVDADAFLSSAGLCVSGRSPRAPAMIIPESALLSEPIFSGSRLLLTTFVLGWPTGAFVRVSWQGQNWAGRILSRLIQADNREGPWKSELEMEMIP